MLSGQWSIRVSIWVSVTPPSFTSLPSSTASTPSMPYSALRFCTPSFEANTFSGLIFSMAIARLLAWSGSAWFEMMYLMSDRSTTDETRENSSSEKSRFTVSTRMLSSPLIR